MPRLDEKRLVCLEKKKEITSKRRQLGLWLNELRLPIKSRSLLASVEAAGGVESGGLARHRCGLAGLVGLPYVQ